MSQMRTGGRGAGLSGGHSKDLQEYPFLVKTLVTFTKANTLGKEEMFKEEVVFKLDRAAARMPWYVLRNYSVPKFLTKKHGPHEVAWQRIYEIKIVKLIDRKNPNDITDIPLRIMTLSQLKEYVIKWELNVPVEEFYSVEKAREMVALRQHDLKGYEKHLAEYREGKQRSYPELDNMRGDKEAAMVEVVEFDSLDKTTEKDAVAKKPEPAVEAEPSTPEAMALDEDGGTIPPKAGDVPKTGDPFAGV